MSRSHGVKAQWKSVNDIFLYSSIFPIAHTLLNKPLRWHAKLTQYALKFVRLMMLDDRKFGLGFKSLSWFRSVDWTTSWMRKGTRVRYIYLLDVVNGKIILRVLRVVAVLFVVDIGHVSSLRWGRRRRIEMKINLFCYLLPSVECWIICLHFNLFRIYSYFSLIWI